MFFETPALRPGCVAGMIAEQHTFEIASLPSGLNILEECVAIVESSVDSVFARSL